MPDAGLLRQYLAAGMPHGEPICMSFGETWDRIPPGLADCLRQVPRSSHGYQLSLHGLPRLRTALAAHLTASHRLPDTAERGRHWEVGVSWTGTRAAMFDFARLVLDRRPATARRPVALVAGPAWDYAGVLTPLGYDVRHLPLRFDRGFVPDPEELAELAAEIARDPAAGTAMVVVNAQHNPTAVNWSPDSVNALLDAAESAGAAVLIDDAYLNVHDVAVEPTSALRLLLDRRRAAGNSTGAPWLAVQSMGKQFGCNGWGVGAVTAPPEILDALVNGYRLHHSLMSSGMLQHAMADWLESVASTQFLAEQRVRLTETRAAAEEQFVKRLGYPASAVHTGECTPYIVVRVPPGYAGDEESAREFRAVCFERTGVLTAPVWPWPMPAPEEAGHDPQLRLYLGSGTEGVTEAVRRMSAAGLTWTARPAG
ncbi:pyridoxal phosphate-dependent aminotransferase [Streptomyces pactum]|uniref:Pyridoxal phosphate-dependent aminotransferase n=1 Tax=Streptomyces pactum TaxID=68249 RepID=A0ABS0NIW7_9ACTN|nr:pyridoxal phosphate-dependent aminotransferase [Streptomyces pactum]MBH5335145.1 pyridoxal phosphate-dependent aminotransferase [Streptomyces pactum]